MKVPKAITLGTKEYVEIITKLHLYIARYGCAWVHSYLNYIPLRYRKAKGRNAGAYIIAKICQEYRVTQFELFNSSDRKELTVAKQLLCALVSKHLGYSQVEIASYFDKTKHFAHRSIHTIEEKLKENHPFDKEVIARYRKLDGLIMAYMVFDPTHRIK